MEEMKIVVKTITPADAQCFLATSRGNRTISRQTVEAMARDMERGAWALNGESIVFDNDGHLVEGHHRLNAVIKANVPVTMSLIYNAPDTWIYDNTRPRSPRDQLVLNGEDKVLTSCTVQATIRWHYVVKKGISKITLEEFKAFYKRNEDVIKKVYTLQTIGTTIIRKAPFTYALLCAYKCGVPYEILKSFCEICAYGNIESADETAAVKMREYIYTHSHGSAAERKALMCATENAIRDYAERRPRKKNYTTTCRPVYSCQRIIDLL